MTRKYTSRETRWVIEYIQRNWSDAYLAGHVTFQASLGPSSTGVYARTAPRADAVIELENEIIILEAEAENVSSSLGQLIYYDYIFPYTEQYKDKAEKPRRLILLVEKELPFLRAFASKHNIQLDTWAPQWLEEYLKSKRGTAAGGVPP